MTPEAIEFMQNTEAAITVFMALFEMCRPDVPHPLQNAVCENLNVIGSFLEDRQCYWSVEYQVWDCEVPD